MLKIGLIGEYSSGKSSLLNAMAGGFVSTNSLLRETIQTEGYVFNDRNNMAEISNKLDEKHKNNKIMKSNIDNLESADISTPTWNMDIKNYLLDNKFIIYDFPGLNDSRDDDGLFMETIKNNIDNIHVLIFITDISRAFTTKSEVDIYNQLKNMVNEQNENGNYTHMIIMTNKYDEIDEDLNILYEELTDKIGTDEDVFKFSSHRFFIHQLMKHDFSISIPDCQRKETKKILKNAGIPMNKEINNSISEGILSGKVLSDGYNIDEHYNNGDWDNAINYLQDIQNNLQKNIKLTKYKYISNVINVHNKKDVICTLSGYIMDTSMPMFSKIKNLFESIEKKELVVYYVKKYIKKLHPYVLIRLYLYSKRFKFAENTIINSDVPSHCNVIDFYKEYFTINENYPKQIYNNIYYIWKKDRCEEFGIYLMLNAKNKHLRNAIKISYLTKKERLYYYHRNNLPIDSLKNLGLYDRFIYHLHDDGTIKYNLFRPGYVKSFENIDQIIINRNTKKK